MEQGLKIINGSYVESEKPIIDAFNRQASKDAMVQLGALSEIDLLGSTESAVLLVLDMDSGYAGVEDFYAFNDADVCRLFNVMRSSGKPAPHIALCKEARELNPEDWKMTALCSRWEKRIGKSLLAEVEKISGAEDPLEWLAWHFASRELVCYHATKLDLRLWEKMCKEVVGEEIAPHQKMMALDVKTAIENKTPIVIASSVEEWLKFGDKHISPHFSSYEHLFACTSSENGSIAPDSITRLGSNEPAWDELTKAMSMRAKGLE